jgi:hypothetical protein
MESSDVAQVAFNDEVIIYDPEMIKNLWEWTHFVLLEVPKEVITILDTLPSSDFYFHWPVKPLSNLPGREPEFLRPTKPIETINKAKRLVVEKLNLPKAA